MMNLNSDTEFIGIYLREVQYVLDRLPMDKIGEAIERLHEARMRGRRIFIVGNGGSASTASHFACDLAKNTRQPGQPLMHVWALTDNMAVFSAYANDEGYENVFVHQLDPSVDADDIIVAISTSGNSGNIIKAVRLAQDRRALAIGLTGFDGGQLAAMADLNLHVPSDCIEQIEDVHLLLCHLITSALRGRAAKGGDHNTIVVQNNGRHIG